MLQSEKNKNFTVKIDFNFSFYLSNTSTFIDEIEEKSVKNEEKGRKKSDKFPVD